MHGPVYHIYASLVAWFYNIVRWLLVAYMAMTFTCIYPYTMDAYIHICLGPVCFLFAHNKRKVLIDETLTVVLEMETTL